MVTQLKHHAEVAGATGNGRPVECAIGALGQAGARIASVASGEAVQDSEAAAIGGQSIMD